MEDINGKEFYIIWGGLYDVIMNLETEDISLIDRIILILSIKQNLVV